MFGVKVLVTIIALQILHNSHSLPYGGLRAMGTYMGIANGILSLVLKQTRSTHEIAAPTTNEDGPKTQIENKTVPYIDVLNFDETKSDESRRRPVNCSTSCARKTFKELIFINKLVQSMESMYGNINERLNEITRETGRAKRSTFPQNIQDDLAQRKEHVKRSQETPESTDSTTKSKFFPEYGVAYHHFASIYPGLRRTFLHIRIKIPDSPTLCSFATLE